MERTLNVGGSEVRMRASALIPRIYRFKFGRDLVKDMSELEKAYRRVAEDEKAELSVLDLTVFENISWVMAKAADANIPDDPDEWLDTIDGVFSVYEVLPQILGLWLEGLEQTSQPRKK